MRILADENFPGDAIVALRERGHDVAWIRTDAPGSSDPAVLQRAQEESRLLSFGWHCAVSYLSIFSVADRADRYNSSGKPERLGGTLFGHRGRSHSDDSAA